MQSGLLDTIRCQFLEVTPSLSRSCGLRLARVPSATEQTEGLEGRWL